MANRVSAAERIAAMSLYGDRRRRTAVIRLDRSITGPGVVRRADVLEMLDKAVRRQSVEAVGQLQNNSTWEVLFRDIETKMQFERQEHLRRNFQYQPTFLLLTTTISKTWSR